MKTSNALQIDERYVYSHSGKAYPRIPPRNRNHVQERRLPFLKRVKAKGRFYTYFIGPNRTVMGRLPDLNDPAFDNAYLQELAKLEGAEAPAYVHPVRSHVYFIGCAAAIKIGVAVDVPKRFKAIQAHSPVPVEVFATTIGDRAVEQDYHRRFAHARLHGEWFSPHPDILAEIERLSK